MRQKYLILLIMAILNIANISVVLSIIIIPNSLPGLAASDKN
jgi:hypothetical protein